MSHRRFFVNLIADHLNLTGDNHNHLSFVLRAKKGDIITLCPEDGCDYTAEITDIKKNETAVKIIDKITNTAEPDIDLTLFTGLLKGAKNEFIIQKCTELGVNTFYPLITKYTQPEAKKVNIQRFLKIAEEAAKQSGRANIPKIYDAIGLPEAARLFLEFDAVIVLYEKEKVYAIKEVLTGLSGAKKIAAVVGGEGGFSDGEAEMLASVSNVRCVSLGNRILRAETACITAASIIMYQAGQMG